MFSGKTNGFFTFFQNMRSRTRILTKHAKTNTNEYENENEYENVSSRNSLAIALSRLVARPLPETASRLL